MNISIDTLDIRSLVIPTSLVSLQYVVMLAMVVYIVSTIRLNCVRSKRFGQFVRSRPLLDDEDMGGPVTL